MNIESITVSGLHGAIDATLNFHTDLAIIVGINGSGKTSIINLTAHLLKLNLPELLKVSFEKIEVTGRDVTGKRVSVRATKSEDTVKLVATRSRRKIDEFSFASPAVPTYVDRTDEKSIWERYARRAAIEISETPLAKFLRDNAKLTLVRLDRTLFAEDFTGVIAVGVDSIAAARALRREANDADPVSQVERATRDKFSEYQNQFKQLNQALTNKLVLQLFETTDVFSSNKSTSHRSPPSPDAKQIGRLEKSIRESSFYPEGSAERETIAQYFKITSTLARQYSRLRDEKAVGDEAVWARRFYQSATERFTRLSRLAEEFDKFDARVRDAYREVGAFLDTINSFLIESSKEAFFSTIDNTLRFRIRGASDISGRPISELSSGEKQIVTLLAYLAYRAGKNSIFLIDEPELSLHISWQAKLLAALKSLRPEGCQLIMATHSPEIVGEERDKVVRLTPDYRRRESNSLI